MIYDYYAYLAPEKKLDPQAPEKKLNPQYDEKKGASCLASGFVDECIILSDSNKEEARDKYSKDGVGRKAKIVKRENFKIPKELNLEKPNFSKIPSHWFPLEIPFTLQTPWYSKDDKPFHILDNPLHKDKVFGVPFMPASAWKGLLRWACRMQAGLFDNIDNWKDKKEDEKTGWIVHLFGNDKKENDKKEEDIFQRGALVFYPTWFSKIGFEVINPHSREKRAGTNPILYEVVPAGTIGTLYLLYAPMNIEKSKKYREKALNNLVTAIKQLLKVYGFSAKRTAGWGIATIEEKDINNIKQRLGDYYEKNS